MPAALRQTLEICIDPAGENGLHPVRARILETNQRAHNAMRLDIPAGELARAGQWLARGDPATARSTARMPGQTNAQAAGQTAAMQDFGARLFDALFGGPVRTLYDHAGSQPDRPLAFWLIVDDPALAQAPWELLFDRDGRGLLALSAPFARGVSGSAPPPTDAARAGPLRVLMASAFPAGFPGLAANAPQSGGSQSGGSQPGGSQDGGSQDGEFQNVTRALGRQAGTGVQLTDLEHATAARLQNALREAEEQGAPYDVFHIICHGVYDPATGRRALVLENEQGQPAAVDPPLLAALLAGHGVQAVFLNACGSGGPAGGPTAGGPTAGDLAPGFAQALLAGATRALIGMQAPVQVGDAIHFAEEFYTALADGRSIDQALLDVRRLAQVRDGSGGALAIPVCYTRVMPAYLRPSAPPLADEVPAGKTAEKTPPWWQRAWRWAAGAGVLLISILAGYLTLRDFFCDSPLGAGPPLQSLCAVLAPAPPLPPVPTPQPTPRPWLSGDIKIAVADFGSVDAAGVASADPKGAEMAQNLYTALQTDLAGLAPPALVVGANVSPAAVGPITGADLAAQMENAARRAAEINADMLVFGNLHEAAGNTRLESYFYLGPGQLTFAEELSDSYPLLVLESKGQVGANAVTSSELRTQLLAQAGGVADLILGMGYFNRQQYGEAARWLAEADAVLAAGPAQKHAVVQLFLASTAAQLGDLPAAHQYFEAAHQADPRLGRALIGRGQIVFLLARRGCTQGATDIAGVQRAIADYVQALSIPSNPQAAIATKANLALGSAHLCLALAGDDGGGDGGGDDGDGDGHWATAQQHFDQVLSDYAAAGSPRLQTLAAQAHERLGALAIGRAVRQPADGSAGPALIEQAAASFEQAVALSLEPGSLARSHLWLAGIAALQGRCQAAQTRLALAREAFAARQALDAVSVAYAAFVTDFNDLNDRWVQPTLAEKCAP